MNEIERRMVQRILWSMLALGINACAVQSGAANELDGRELLASLEDSAEGRAATKAPCSPASIFAPDEISLPERDEFRLAFTPSGSTAYYHVDTADPPYQKIYETHLRRGHWTPGVPVAFNSYADSDAFVAPDGKTMFFCSQRPRDGVPVENSDIWVTRLEGGTWGEPTPLGPEINTLEEELYPSVTEDGTLYFARGTFTDTGDFDIYRAVRGPHGYEAPERLDDAVNSAAYWEFNPWVSANGKVLFFASRNRPDTKGGIDIYVSVNRFGRWQPAIHLGSNVNTAGPEFHPTFAAKQGKLYFVRPTGDPSTSNFYSVDAQCLFD